MKRTIWFGLIASFILLSFLFLSQPRTYGQEEWKATDNIGFTCNELVKARNSSWEIDLDLLPKAKVKRINLKGQALLQDLKGAIKQKKISKIKINGKDISANLANEIKTAILQANYKDYVLFSPFTQYSRGLLPANAEIYSDEQKKIFDVELRPDSMVISYEEKGGCTTYSREPNTSYDFQYTLNSFDKGYQHIKDQVPGIGEDSYPSFFHKKDAIKKP